MLQQLEKAAGLLQIIRDLRGSDLKENEETLTGGVALSGLTFRRSSVDNGLREHRKTRRHC